MSAQPQLSRPWLLADIGGTNARFGWLAEGDSAVSHVQTLRGADHPGPQDAARHYLHDLQTTLGSDWKAPRAGAFAVATAPDTDRIAFTNSDWAFSRRETCQALGLDALLVLNDFAALALSLPSLKAGKLRAFGPGHAMAGGARAVLGPGTGLGVAGLVDAGNGHFVAVAGEGGHATLAAADDHEAAVLAAARRVHGHVSAERLLSGIGMPSLHAAVAAVAGQPVPVLTTPQIVACGLAPAGADDRADPLCRQTLDIFCALLGGFAGDVALTFGARGGVYIGGGIVPRLGDLFFASRFRERFEAKGRFDDYLQAIPTFLVTDTLAALEGAARALGQHRPESGSVAR